MYISAKYKYIIGLLAFVAITSAASLFYSCKSTATNNSAIDSSIKDDDLTTKQLITRYCTKCHAATSPNLLSRDVWNFHTLPSMATLVGLSTYGNSYFKNDTSKGISLVNWHKIVDYYLKAAPVKLDAQKRPDSLLNDWAGFRVKLPAPYPGIKTAFTTTVSLDTFTHRLYSADGGTLKVYSWSKDLKPAQVTETLSPVIHIESQKGAGTSNQVLTAIGVLEPMDYPNGRILSGELESKNLLLKTIETDLSRPVYTSAGDFNKDGLMDYVISVNGGLKGALIWMKQNADKTFSRNVIKKPAGPVQTTVSDFNNDGWPDIMALYGSGNEGLSLFINDKKGGFKERQLLQFPPTYGSTSFQLIDINHDGKLDLVYSCGYNFRDSRILKPYTGLYIYLNTGDWHFKQSYFYPINGCTKAIAADFDGDGDVDIATSAFFADLKSQPGESFIYFEQDKNMHFKPHAVPVSKYGRWFSMDAGDFNGDGKPDIILGNYAKGLNIGTNQYQGAYSGTPLIVLENQTKK